MTIPCPADGILYVDAGAPGVCTGSSWGNALAGLQEALAFAATCPDVTEIWVADGTYHLLYSANRWDTADYAVGHAVCETITGPCVKDPEPWITDHGRATGPGGQEVIIGPAGDAGLLVYHAWTDGDVGYDVGARSLFVTPIRVVDGTLETPRLELDGA